MNGLNWYNYVSSFLSNYECYLTTPIFDSQLLKRVISLADKTNRIGVNTEYRVFGLNVRRGSHGNSIIIPKNILSEILASNGISEVELLENGSIVAYTAAMFRDCAHKRKQNKKRVQEAAKKRKDFRRWSILHSESASEKEKHEVLLDIWSDKKLENNDIATTKYESYMFKRLYKTYHKRVKQQQKFIVNDRVYFVDIYMKSCKAAIEIDGGYHNTEKQIKKDKQRDADLSSLGLLVIRIPNEKVRLSVRKLRTLLDKRHRDIISGISVQRGTIKF